MELAVTPLIIVEHIIVSVLVGMSTVAVFLYAAGLRCKQEGGVVLVTKIVYKVIRLFHLFFITLVAFSLLTYGILDGSATATVVYGIKALVLGINAIVAYGMYKRIFPIAYAAPIPVAGWYFLFGYHAYVVYTSATTALMQPLMWYLLTGIVLQIVFVTLRLCLRPHDAGHLDNQQKEDTTGYTKE